jgi:hypothetical protein
VGFPLSSWTAISFCPCAICLQSCTLYWNCSSQSLEWPTIGSG